MRSVVGFPRPGTAEVVGDAVLQPVRRFVAIRRRNRIHVRLADRKVPTIGKEEFLRNKRAVGRPRDVADVADIEAQPEGAR